MVGKLNRILIYLSEEELVFAKVSGERLVTSLRVLRRESSVEILAEKAKPFIQGKGPFILVLPRSMALQRSFEFESREPEAFQQKLQEVLPYRLDEMAYAAAQESSGSDSSSVTLVSMPEKSVKDHLFFLAQLGFEHVDEIVTEDQGLWWIARSLHPNKRVLALDLQPKKGVATFSQGNQLYFSRDYVCETPGSFEEVAEDFMRELSILLLECGKKPETLLLTGEVGPSLKGRLEAQFEMAAEAVVKPQAWNRIETSLFGVATKSHAFALSLLPKEKKIKKWQKSRVKLLTSTGILLLLFVLMMVGVFELQSLKLRRAVEKTQSKIAAIQPEIREVNQMLEDIEKRQRTSQRNAELLELLTYLSLEIPDVITLREFRLDQGMLLLKGESPAYAYLTDVVGILENSKILSEVSLEHSRIRKRLSEDFFEFEVSGQWKV